MICPLQATPAQLAWQHRADHGVDPGALDSDCIQELCAWWIPGAEMCAAKAMGMAALGLPTAAKIDEDTH